MQGKANGKSQECEKETFVSHIFFDAKDFTLT